MRDDLMDGKYIPISVRVYDGMCTIARDGRREITTVPLPCITTYNLEFRFSLDYHFSREIEMRVYSLFRK